MSDGALSRDMAEERNHINSADDHSKVTVLLERQRRMQKQLDDLEENQKDMGKLMNRFIGGTALLIGVGVFIGWLFTIGSGVLTFLHK
jgi:hypothetical protein